MVLCYTCRKLNRRARPPKLRGEGIGLPHSNHSTRANARMLARCYRRLGRRIARYPASVGLLHAIITEGFH